MELKSLARGTLTPIKRTRSGKTFYCLQYRKNGRHVCRYVPAEAAEAYREATENYRRLMEAVDAHVEKLSEQTRMRIEEEVMRKRKNADTSDGRDDSAQGL